MTANVFASQLKSRLIESEGFQKRRLTEAVFKGCTDAEIDACVRAQDVRFVPAIYREFMRVMGDNAGSLFPNDADYSCERVCFNKEIALEILEDIQSHLQLQDDVFVIVTVGGYIFDFFHTAAQLDDPPVYRYYEGSASFALQSENLSTYFYNLI